MFTLLITARVQELEGWEKLVNSQAWIYRKGRETENQGSRLCRSKQEKKIYVQVSYLLASPETEEREFSVLESIQDNYPKYVLSMDPILRNRSGIVHQHITDFLLGSW